jgi:protein-S-isoprenylcysteine O-methyltransferase Ste14
VAAVEVSRWFLAFFFSGVAVFYTTTILVKKQRGGRSPVIRGAPGSVHRVVHDIFAVFRALILIVCIARVPYPTIDRWLVPIPVLWQPALITTGNVLMLAAFVIIVLLHRGMGTAWRSGVDPVGPPRLMTSGAFSVSRNPMFLSVQAAQIGLFLSLPTLFTLICLIVGIAAIQVQVTLEERHLEAHCGEVYRAYKKRVPRWLFRWH